MLKVIRWLTINEFEPWDGAIETFNIILNNGDLNRLEYVLEKFYPDGISLTDLNYLLWFEKDWIFKMLKSTDEEILDLVSEWSKLDEDN